MVVIQTGRGERIKDVDTHTGRTWTDNIAEEMQHAL